MAASTDLSGITDSDVRRRRLNWLGLVVTIAWIAICIFYVQTQIGWSNLGGLLPHELGAALAGVAAPLVFLWLLVANFAGRRDGRENMAALRREIARLTAAPAAPASHVEVVGEDVTRQTEALQRTSDAAAGVLDRIGGIFAEQLAELDGATTKAGTLASEIEETLQRLSA